MFLQIVIRILQNYFIIIYFIFISNLFHIYFYILHIHTTYITDIHTYLLSFFTYTTAEIKKDRSGLAGYGVIKLLSLGRRFYFFTYVQHLYYLL